jgi:hypothetical protein
MPDSRDWRHESVLAPFRDWRAVAQQYAAQNVSVLDDLLSEAALAELREWCLQSTVWQDARAGYVGAYRDGFSPPVLMRLAEQLHDALPDILGKHTLKFAWAHHYDSARNSQGIAPHVDEAAVNINLWLTPNEANMQAQRGGLRIWQTVPDFDRSASDYNGYEKSREATIRRALADVPAVTVPHSANRAVLFHSDLWHASDGAKFKPGYRNCRINLTLLFGERQTWSKRTKRGK